MNVKRLDVISMFDVKYRALSRKTRPFTDDSAIADNLRTSYDWMFYGTALPGCLRQSLVALTTSLPAERGATLLLYPKVSAGVCSVWQQFDSSHDPRAEKDSAWKWYGDSNTYQTELEHIGIALKSTERVYTFVSLVVDVAAADLSRFCLENAEELGRIFTGGYESEEPSQLRSYIETGNLS